MSKPATPIPSIPSWERSNALRVRCKAWSSYPVQPERVHVCTDGTVCVWDAEANRFTALHALSPRACRRIVALYREHAARVLAER